MKKALLMINPKSGKQAARLGLYSIIANLSLKYEVTVHITRSGEDIVETARNTELPTLIVCGGDGTLSCTVNGLMQNPRRKDMILGYIPCGTANDVASTLEIPKSPSAAALYVCRNTPKKHDIGRFAPIPGTARPTEARESLSLTEGAGRPFVYTASFGTFTKASYETPQDLKNRLGGLAYVLGGASEILNIRGYRVVIETPDRIIEKKDVTFLNVSNSHFVGGGLVRLPVDFAGLSDGMLELLTVSRPKNLFELENICRSLLLRDFNNEYISLIQAPSYRITVSEPVAWTLDGEAGGETAGAVLSCLPGALNLIRREPGAPA